MAALMGTWTRAGRREKVAMGIGRNKEVRNVRKNGEKAGCASLGSITDEPRWESAPSSDCCVQDPKSRVWTPVVSGVLGWVGGNITDVRALSVPNLENIPGGWQKRSRGPIYSGKTEAALL
jgi:hypothetical protein